MAGEANNENLFGPAYKRGTILFLYGLLWPGFTFACFLATGQMFLAGSGVVMQLVGVTLAAGLAGGVGGATTMLNRLSRHISGEQNFARQPIFPYIIQPIAGLVAGILIFYLVVLPATLLVNYIGNGQLLLAESLASSTVIALTMLLAWSAGFYQQQGFARLKATLQGENVESSLPQPAPTKTKEAPLPFKVWHQRRQMMVRWSYTWGVFIFVYGVAWIIVLLLSNLMWGIALFSPDTAAVSAANNAATTLVLAAWPSIIAGGIGGVVGMLNDLYRHVSIKQDFHRRQLMLYLVQPAVGSVFGAVIYFLVAAGYLGLQPLFNAGETAPVVDSPAMIMAQLVLAWLAGFRNQTVTELILKLVADVVAFVKLVGQLIHPMTLFDAEKRQQALNQIGKKDEVFKAVAEKTAPLESQRTSE